MSLPIVKAEKKRKHCGHPEFNFQITRKNFLDMPLHLGRFRLAERGALFLQPFSAHARQRDGRDFSYGWSSDSSWLPVKTLCRLVKSSHDSHSNFFKIV